MPAAPFRSLADRKSYPVIVLTRWGRGTRKDSQPCLFSGSTSFFCGHPLAAMLANGISPGGGSFLLICGTTGPYTIFISAIDENAPPARGEGASSRIIRWISAIERACDLTVEPFAPRPPNRGVLDSLAANRRISPQNGGKEKSAPGSREVEAYHPTKHILGPTAG